MTPDEFHDCDGALRSDPRIVDALARRGVTDLDLVLFDTWAYGAELVPERYRGRRLAWADVWHRNSPDANPYANMLAGLHPIIDLNAMELLELEDDDPGPPPEIMGEYAPALVPGLSLAATSARSRSPSPTDRRSRYRATCFAGRSGRCGSASTSARDW